MEFSLDDLGLIDTAPEPGFDNLTALASQVLDAPVSLVSIVEFDRDRQYFKSHSGLPEPFASDRQTPLSYSFCQHVVRNNAALVVNDAMRHPLVKDNLAIPALGVLSYLGMPVHQPDNTPVGALCVIDNRPRQWSNREVATMQRIARCVTDVISLSGALHVSEQLQREMMHLNRSVSHDLKTPASALKSLLEEMESD